MHMLILVFVAQFLKNGIECNKTNCCFLYLIRNYGVEKKLPPLLRSVIKDECYRHSGSKFTLLTKILHRDPKL